MTDAQVRAILDESSCMNCLTGVSIPQLIKLGLLYQIASGGSGGALSPPVQSFVDRAVITSIDQKTALENLYQSAVANGWWSKCDLIYPFVGGTAGAHAQNLKSTSFTITWNGLVTHNANGITGDVGGGVAYGNTDYIPSSSGSMTLNLAHLSAYRRNQGLGLGSLTAAVGSGLTNGLVIQQSSIDGAVRYKANDATYNNQNTVPLGFVMISRVDAANKYLYTSTQRTNAVASTSIPSVRLFVLALSDNAGNPVNSTPHNVAGITAGIGMSFAEYSTMAADWQTFQTALGRQV